MVVLRQDLGDIAAIHDLQHVLPAVRVALVGAELTEISAVFVEDEALNQAGNASAYGSPWNRVKDARGRDHALGIRRGDGLVGGETSSRRTGTAANYFVSARKFDPGPEGAGGA